MLGTSDVTRGKWMAGTRAPTFTVFRLSGPDRLVVDLSSADATTIKGHHDGQGPVSGIVASQFTDERASVGRVLVALSQAAQYDVRAEGNSVVISVDGAQSAAAPQAAAAVSAPVAAASKPTTAAKPAAPALAENVVAAEADEREVANPARRITALTLAEDMLQVATDGEVARYEVLQLADPARLAVDIYGVGLSARAPKARSGLLKEVRAGAHADKVRLVLDVRGEMPAYRVERSARGLDVLLGAAVARRAAPRTTATPAEAVAQISSAPAAAQGDETAPLRPAPRRR
jgi:type IV pilus assembly protein PilQ